MTLNLLENEIMILILKFNFIKKISHFLLFFLYFSLFSCLIATMGRVNSGSPAVMPTVGAEALPCLAEFGASLPP